MHKLLINLIFALALALPAGAGAQQRRDGSWGQWLSEMRQYKRNYFIKELDLSREQQSKFFPLYEEMEDQTFKIDEEARTMERRLEEAPDATDTEYEKATEALYDARVSTAAIEKEYLEKFKSILSKKQLFKLKGVERQFARDMMKQHHRLRSERKDRPEKSEKTPAAR